MIKYENIEIKYGDFVAIDNLNLDIREGEFFTFLGPSGCGKTTSLRALVGFLTPSKGKVYVGDQSPGREKKYWHGVPELCTFPDNDCI